MKIPITRKAKTRSGDQSTDVCHDESYFYTASSFGPIWLVPVVDTFINKCTAIIVTKKTTDKYCLLAASQLNTHDHVLKIGCSNGECSLVISKHMHARM